MNKMVVLLFSLVAISGLTFHGWRWFNRAQPQRHSAVEEEQVGRFIAELIAEYTPAEESVTILYLFRRGTAPYDARARILRELLEQHATIVNEVWAQDEGHYEDEDYADSMDISLREFPEATTLVVVSAGYVTHARPSRILERFLRHGGKLFLVGSASEQSQLVTLARRGQAVILARRQSWLSDAPPHPRLLRAPEYVRANFTLLHHSLF